MINSNDRKELIKNRLREKLSNEQEIEKIVLFGSFINSNNPHDVDVAIFQNSDEQYLALALKYRKLVKDISKFFPVDVIPMKSSVKDTFLDNIENGEIIYEK